MILFRTQHIARIHRSPVRIPERSPDKVFEGVRKGVWGAFISVTRSERLSRNSLKGSRSRGGVSDNGTTATMEGTVGYNFVSCDRDQQFLMPPSLNEWLPKDHPARFVVEMVDVLDLSGFYARRRADGWGRAAYDPKMMVALLIYAYATGTRSSRKIEIRVIEDVAVRFIAANESPDHAHHRALRQRPRGRARRSVRPSAAACR